MAEIRRKGPNKYLIMIFLGRDADGKRVYEREQFNGSLPKARLRAAELESDLKKRVGPASLAMNVGEYMDRWLVNVKSSLSQRGYDTYCYHAGKLKSVLGKLPMYDLNGMTIQEALTLDRSGTLSKLKPKTLKGIYGTLRTAMRQAVAWGILHTDPTVGLRAPRVPREERKVLLPNELLRLLEAAKRYKYHLVIRVIAITGIRLGEALGLKWSDIDLKKGVISVKRAADIRNRVLKETKNASSERTLKIDPETVALLTAYRKERKTVSMGGLVFTHDNGGVAHESAVRRSMNNALKKAGLSHMRIHDLRHTSGSLLLDAGYTLPTVAAFLGHSSPATTAAVYAHAVRKGVDMGKVLGLNGGDGGEAAHQAAHQTGETQ